MASGQSTSEVGEVLTEAVGPIPSSGSSDFPCSIAVDVLGPLGLRIDGALVDVSRAQVRQVLALLCAAPDHTVSIDSLCDLLWPDQLPARPRQALNVVLSRLRSTLGEHSDCLVSISGGYRLDGVDIDVDRFIDLVRGAESQPASEAHQSLRAALDMWRGDPFTEGSTTMLEQRRTELNEMRWTALTRLAEALSELGRPADAAQLVSPYLSEAPERQRLICAGAHALAAAGRKTDALRLIAATTTRLRNEHGLDPAPELVRLERSILDGAVDLMVERSSSATSGRVDPGVRQLVGREAEVERVGNALPGSVMTVIGEPGIGKSSVVREAVLRRKLAGGTAYLVTVASLPQRPIETVARLCTELAGLPDAGPMLEEHAAAVSRVCPELADVVPRTALTRVSLASSLAKFIAALANDALIVIDDAQWLDAGSVAVFERLAELGGPALVFTQRPTAAPVVDLTGFDGVQSDCVIGPFGEESIAALAGSMGFSRIDAATLRDIAMRSGGNVLFARLLLSWWAEGHNRAASLPTDVLVIVKEQLDGMSREAAETLKVAALVGSSFAPAYVQEIRPQADDELRAAAANGLVQFVEPDLAQFSHELVAEACRELLAPGHRIAWHDRIADVLERHGRPAVAVAEHCLAAAALDPHRALRVSFAAATEFADVFDWDAVLAQLDQVESLIEEQGIDQPLLRIELLVRRGSALKALGDRSCVSLLIDGATGAFEHGDDLLAALALINLCEFGPATEVGVDPTIASLLERALDLELPSVRRAELCASASVFYSQSDSVARGRTLYLEALDIAADLADIEAKAIVFSHAHLGLSHPDDFDRLCGAARQLTRLAGSDDALRWEAAFLRFQTSAVLADAEGADEALREMRATIPLIRGRSRAVGMAFTESAVAQFRGDFETAERHADSMLELASARYGAEWSANIYGLLIVGIRLQQGRLPEFAEFVDSLVQARPDYAPYPLVAARCAFEAGDESTAYRYLSTFLADGMATVPRDVYFVALVWLTAEVVAACGSPAERQVIGSLLEPFSGRMSWNGVSSFGPVDAALAAIARADGEHALADRLGRRAAQLTEAMRTLSTPVAAAS